MTLSNLTKVLPTCHDNEVFETLSKGKACRIERIVSYGHVTKAGEWYDQAQNEWVMLVQGEAKLRFFDNSVHNLKAGDYINIPAHVRHRVDWTKPSSETVWLAIHYE